MAERSGVAGQFGLAAEETYGTYKAPATFYPLDSESLSCEKDYIRYAGLRAGRLMQAKTLHVGTTRSAGGGVNLPFLNQGMGKILNMLHGETVTPTKIEEKLAYKQLHKIGLSSPYGKSLTMQVGRPGTDGTVRAFSYLGCKILSAQITVERGGIMTISVTVDAQDEVTGESLGSATYDTDAIPLNFTQIVAKAAGSELANVRQITWNIEIPQSTDRHHLGNSGVKDQPIINGFVNVTADATLEFVDLTDHNRFKEETVVKLEALGTGGVITEALKFKANLTSSAAKQVSSSPVLAGPDILTTDVSFECLDNGSETPLEIEYVSSDSAL
jgi:hypothetical protein